MTFVVYAALGGALFLLPVQLQVVDGYSPLEAGASLLPLTVLMLALSARSGRLAARIGPRLQMSVGPLAIGLGLALLGRAATDASYVSGVLPGVVVLGLGLATTVAPLTATALGALPDGHAGLASAVNNDVARLGGLVAVAVLPVARRHHGRQLPAPDGARERVPYRRADRRGLLRGSRPSSRPSGSARPRTPRRWRGPGAEPCFHCALEARPARGAGRSDGQAACAGRATARCAVPSRCSGQHDGPHREPSWARC